MERYLITKIKELINNEPECNNVEWFLNALNEYVCIFDYDNSKFIVTIEELNK